MSKSDALLILSLTQLWARNLESEEMREWRWRNVIKYALATSNACRIMYIFCQITPTFAKVACGHFFCSFFYPCKCGGLYLTRCIRAWLPQHLKILKMNLSWNSPPGWNPGIVSSPDHSVRKSCLLLRLRDMFHLWLRHNSRHPCSKADPLRNWGMVLDFTWCTDTLIISGLFRSPQIIGETSLLQPLGIPNKTLCTTLVVWDLTNCILQSHRRNMSQSNTTEIQSRSSHRSHC